MEFSSEQELEAHVRDPGYADRTMVYAAIVFPEAAGGSGVDVSYTIRVNASSVPDTSSMTSAVRAAHQAAGAQTRTHTHKPNGSFRASARPVRSCSTATTECR